MLDSRLICWAKIRHRIHGNDPTQCSLVIEFVYQYDILVVSFGRRETKYEEEGIPGVVREIRI